MSLFDLRPPVEEKEVVHHPWGKTIKDQYASKIKHAHNSIYNPVYPEKSLRKKEKQPAADRVRFTIIGNRVTKEFIYCVKVAKGLHKWRWTHFDAPVIKGVTSVEWPLIWNDLKIRYGGLSYCLKSQVAVIIDDKFLGGERELQELIENKYVYHFNIDYYKEGVAQFASYVKYSGRPCAYMHISIDNQYIGTMIFMLYADIVPYTCENFLQRCQTKKGGYGGTPVHRIVKDGWIQCGGFGLRATDLGCENFIVPHDRRGVLCMANDGRHVDCSTQFFVLLQPAPWMAYKYVAFGQLIDGESTLEKIENVPTWYESPTSEIIIHQAGILNMDCNAFIINKGTKEYIHSHIENLFELGEVFYEELMEKVFLEVEFRRIQRLTAVQVQEEQVEVEGEEGIRSTKRFIRKKEDIEKQIQSTQADKCNPTSIDSDEQGNRDFDVEQYEPEEYSYQHVTVPPSGSIVVKPEKPYYLPLTDVPYPGEVDSTYDLKKLLRGDYCLEGDLHKVKDLTIPRDALPYISEFLTIDDSYESEPESLDSDDEKEIKKYLKHNLENVSFAGDLIKGIGRTTEKHNLLENVVRSNAARMTDEELRRFRVASSIYLTAACKDKKVHIDVPSGDDFNIKKIKRVQTGFVRPQDIRMYEKSDSDIDIQDDPELRKVRIAPSAVAAPPPPRPARRPTGFVRASELPHSDTEIRQSVLTRLYEEVTYEPDAGPTLKNYTPISEIHKRNFVLLTTSPTCRMTNDDDSKERFYRHSINVEESFENVLNLQHGKKVARKISSDYVNTIDQIEHHPENSIRSVEFAKMRPAMSVSEYQLKNQKYQEELKKSRQLAAAGSIKADLLGKPSI